MPLPKVDSGASNNVGTSKKPKGKSSPTIHEKSRSRKSKLSPPFVAFLGRVSVVRVRDGTSYVGVCVDPGTNGMVKFQNVHKLPEIGFEEFVMPLEIVDNELLIPREDIIDMDVKIGQPSKRFAIDGEYGGNTEDSKNADPHEFQEWNDDTTVTVDAETHGSGWSVDEMLKANASLGVRSTYAEDMSQYTTCDPVGTEEDRARAEEIARQIERDGRSKHMAFLENDDEERDLDKETNIDMGLDQSNKRFNRNQPRGGRGNNYRDGGDNWRGPNTRVLNNNRGRQEFKTQRDRIRAHNVAGNEQRRNQSDDRGYQNNVSGNRKRAEDLRSWATDFHNAYQSQTATPPSVETPQSISTSPIQQPPPQQEQEPTPPPLQESSPKHLERQSSESPEKKFQFNPNAKAFVPKPAPPPIFSVPPPPVTNYVLAPMPQASNMVPTYIPHVPVVYTSQMNQNMQAAPPLIAQPNNLVMQNDMQPNYMSQQQMVLPIPTNVPPPPIIPQNMSMQQQSQRNNGRKIQNNNHQFPQRMMQQQMNQTSFQNFMPQPVYQMTSVPISGPNGMQIPQMARGAGPAQQYFLLSNMVASSYYPRQEFHDPNMISQPATPIPANQPSSPPMNQMIMGVPQSLSQPKPSITVNFMPNYASNQMRGITPLMGINNGPPQNQHMPHRKPVSRRRNE